MTTLLNGAMTRMTGAIKEDLKLARRVVIGMDCWSKKSLTASFLAISASFYHPSRHIPIHVLLNLHQIEHPHTGEMLADKLVETLEYWEIGRAKIMMVVTDNGSNMLKAVKVASDMKQTEQELQDSEEGDETQEEEDEEDEETDEEEEMLGEPLDDSDTLNLHRFPCLAHTLQLVVKELSKNQAYCSLISKVKQLVKSLRMSSVAQEKLTALCGKVPVKDCSTRWNSVLLMIQRLVEIRPHLEEVLKELKHDSLSNTEWSRLCDLQSLLTPFKEQTDSLQTDTLSLSSVIPALLELSLHLQDQSLPKTHTAPLLQSLRQRFASFLDASSISFDPLPAAACLLDPAVSAVMMRDDMGPLLIAAQSYIKRQVTIIGFKIHSRDHSISQCLYL